MTNKKYKILITYDTGDSFDREDGLTSYIEEISWDNLDKAKKALQDIEEHYHFYNFYRHEYSASKRQIEENLEAAKNSTWYEKECPERFLNLYDDNNNLIFVSAFWCGYFESLVEAEIEENDNEMKFTI